MIIIFRKRIFLFALCLYFLAVPAARAGPFTHLAPSQNTVIFWTDTSDLKAVSLISLRPGQKPIGIVAIPVTTKVESGAPETLAQFYRRAGRQGLTGYLEKRFHTPIKTYFCIDQKVLLLASDLVGPITMLGKKTTLLDVFEGSYTEQGVDLQVEIQGLAKAVLEPQVLVKIPALVWLFTTNVETNLSPAHFFAFYQALRGGGPDSLRKEALPGQDYVTGGVRYREVAPEAWPQVLKSVSRP